MIDDELVELLTLTLTVNQHGTRIYSNSQGLRHRVHGPAIEYVNGAKYWYLNGQRHRTTVPAIEWVNGDKEWLLDGQHHRTDGPAVEWANGYKVWYLNDQIHRIDGPAIEYATGTRVWYLNGQQLSEEEFIMVTKYPSGNPVQQCESH